MTTKGIYYRYYASVGDKSTKELRTKSRAKKAATYLSKKYKRPAEYSRITVYPHNKKPGMTDWSVRTLGIVKPKSKRRRK